jgi:hypothetical protein
VKEARGWNPRASEDQNRPEGLARSALDDAPPTVPESRAGGRDMVTRVSEAVVSRPVAWPGRWPWLDRWVTEFGVSLESGLVRIAASQAQLARAEKISAGTVNERVRRLSVAGVLISREPLVVVVADPTPGGVSGTAADGFGLAEQVLTFMREHGVTPEGQAFLVQVIGTLEDSAAAARPVPRLRGLPTAEDPRMTANGQDGTIQSPLLLPVQDLQPDEPRGPRGDRGTPRGTDESTPPAAWRAAVGALAEAAVDRGLPAGARYPERLWEVASSVSAVERLAAITRVTAQVRAGDPIKDPFGLLYSVIDARQPEYLDPTLDALGPDPAAASTRPPGGGLPAQGRDVHPDQLHRPPVAEIERCGVCGKLLLPGNCTCGVLVWRPPSLSAVLPSQGQADASVALAGEGD